MTQSGPSGAEGNAEAETLVNRPVDTMAESKLETDGDTLGDMVAMALGNTLVDVKGEELVEKLVQMLSKCVA